MVISSLSCHFSSHFACIFVFNQEEKEYGIMGKNHCIIGSESSSFEESSFFEMRSDPDSLSELFCLSNEGGFSLAFRSFFNFFIILARKKFDSWFEKLLFRRKFGKAAKFNNIVLRMKKIWFWGEFQPDLITQKGSSLWIFSKKPDLQCNKNKQIKQIESNRKKNYLKKLRS